MTLVKSIYTDTYIGNDGTLSIGIGWQPAIVMIFSESLSGGAGVRRQMSFKILSDNVPDDDYMFESDSKDSFELSTTDGITITASGFDVGNTKGLTDADAVFHYLAIRDNEAIDKIDYTGTTPTDQTFVTNRQPGWVFGIQAEPSPDGQLLIKTPETDSILYQEMNSTTWSRPQRIILLSSGITVGDQANGTTDYGLICLYNTVGSTHHYDTGEFTGNLDVSQDIILGKQPKFIFLWPTSTTVFDGAMKLDTMSGNSGAEFDTSQNKYNWVSNNHITILASGFNTGTLLNSNGVTLAYVAGYE